MVKQQPLVLVLPRVFQVLGDIEIVKHPQPWLVLAESHVDAFHIHTSSFHFKLFGFASGTVAAYARFFV